MPIKRSASSTPTPPLTTGPLPTTPKKTKKAATAKSSPVKSESGSSGAHGEWTGEKKARLIEHLITVGLANSKLDHLAQQFGLSKDQVRNMTRKDKNNLVSKVIAAASAM